jgi:hypothetical protein
MNMLRLPQIWHIIKANLTKVRWFSLNEIYQLIERKAHIDDEDMAPEAPGSNRPKWKRNVRNVLQHRKKTGEIEYAGSAEYKL